MTKLGGVQRRSTVFEVTDKGSGANDGWQLLDSFDSNNLPSGTNREVFFVVSGMMGRLVKGNATNALVQVGLRDSNNAQVFPETIQTFWVGDGNLQDSTLAGRGVPFCFIREYTSSRNGNYGSGFSLQVVARILLNGDPPSITARFRVSELQFQVWDLSNLDASGGDPPISGSGYFSHRYRPQQPQASNIRSENYKTFSLSSSLPFGTQQEWWLVYASVQYDPLDFTGAPHMRIQTDITGTGSSLSPRFFQTNGGMMPRGQPNKVTYCHGGAFLLLVPNNTTILALTGRDWHINASNRTQVRGAEFFAVRLNKMARWKGIVKNDAQFPSRERWYNDIDKSSWTDVDFEPLLQGVVTDLQLLSHGMYLPIDNNRRSWGEMLRDQNGSALHVPSMFVWGASNQSGEAMGTMQGTTIAFPDPAKPQFKQTGICNPGEQKLATDYLGGDQTFLAYHFENDATKFRKDPKPPPPPTVVIVPNREAVSVASLTALPFEPEHAAVSSEDVGAEHSLDTPMGYRLTWPKFLKARRSYALTFQLDRDDKDTLVAFFRDQDRRAFKWTPPEPGSSATAFATISSPIAEQLHGSAPTPENNPWLVRVDVVELVFTGI